jgi:5-methylcytosine-specific restriction endonuclease McrA
MENRKRKYGSVRVVSRLKIFTAEEGLKILDGSLQLGYNLNLSKDRYKCFLKNGRKCYSCNLEGSYFALEYVRSKSYSGYTLNLYGKRESGKEEYFTKDHLIPKSIGGKDELSNYNTMCWTCNHTKGSKS